MDSSIKNKIVNAWNRSSSWIYVLLPVSVLFRIISRLRRWYLGGQEYDAPLPIVVVGNLSVGGTGKTPLVIHLAKLLSAQGISVGVITRGYKGKHASKKSRIISAKTSVESVGDEAVMLAQCVEAPIIVGSNRVDSIKTMLTHFPQTQVILSDDGLQHYRMGRSIEIAMVNGVTRYGNGCCLPAGPLREPLSRLSQVDYRVASHKNLANEFLLSYIPKEFLSVGSVDSTQTVSKSVENHGFDMAHAVAGIGVPETFFLQLESLGIKIIRHSFPDHHRYRESDLAFGDELPIIMTQKDAVKCAGFHVKGMWFLEVDTRISEVFEANFLRRVKGLLYGKKNI